MWRAIGTEQGSGGPLAQRGGCVLLVRFAQPCSAAGDWRMWRSFAVKFRPSSWLAASQQLPACLSMCTVQTTRVCAGTAAAHWPAHTKTFSGLQAVRVSAGNED